MHEIRLCFHKQLEQLWNGHPSLSCWSIENNEPDRRWRYEIPFNGLTIIDGGSAVEPTFSPARTALVEFPGGGLPNFVPLVWSKADLSCSIQVLFLRHGQPGRLFENGDVDNRMKTLVDCLRPPRNANELPPTCNPFPDPLFVLLEDDNLLSDFSVETDELLDASVGISTDTSEAQLIISVEVKPWKVTFMNIHFT